MRKSRVLCLLLSLALIAMPLCAQALVTWIDREGTVAEFQNYSGIKSKRAYVLCENLTVRDAPQWASGSVVRLRYGDSFLTWESQNGWLNAYYSDGAEIGWVREEYVLIDPCFIVTNESTPAYAFDGYDSPRVGLLATGTRLPVVSTSENGYWVSLRGASAFIRSDTVYRPMVTPEPEQAQPLLHLTSARLDQYSPTLGNRTYFLSDPAKLNELAEILTDAEQMTEGTASCPFGTMMLTVTCDDASVYTLDMATDGCTIYMMDGVYYDFTPKSYRDRGIRMDSSILFNMFVEDGGAHG